ncbi:acetoacetate decarboxylase family protein [Altericista sp. CCNU0014]|uniref:acetoacetate decarboxylase family protein n=1 Tax=Altericista sp. CCNU0014 TaxID=3082949 RepID=UPI00384A5AB6
MNASYPPAPWQLYGTAFQTVQLIDLERSQTFIPPTFEVVTILPGKTLGGIYVSIYRGNSTLAYSEAIVVAGLVRYGNQFGAWISHIYVDNPESVAGGRNIWGLPKELAEFEWSEDAVKVRQGNSNLCLVRHGQRGFPLSFFGRWKINGKVFSVLDKDILQFQGRFEMFPKWIRGTVTIPIESPFSRLGLDRPWLVLQLHDLRLNAEDPTVMGRL